MTEFNIEAVFSAISQMNKSQRKGLIATLNSRGLNIRDIECYAYPEAPGIKHLFFHFCGRKEAVPYYLLDSDMLELIQYSVQTIMWH